MRALGLTVYPLREKVGRLAERGYIVDRKPVTHWYVENYQIFEKRLTDTELAAEYWRADGDMDETHYDRDVDAEPIRHILHRFATMPHYDQDKEPRL